MEKAGSIRRRKSESATRYHHGDLRNELIRQGRLLLETSGASEISLAELARRSGVSDAAPFKHFDGKESLLASIATEGMQELVQAQIEIADRDVDRLEKARSMLLNYVRYGQRNPGMFNLMFGPRIVDVSRHPELQAVGARSFQLFVDAIRDAASAHGWSAREIELLTHGAWAMEHGLAALIIASRAPHRSGTVGADEMVEFAVDMTMRSIAAGPAPVPVSPAAKRLPPRRKRT